MEILTLSSWFRRSLSSPLSILWLRTLLLRRAVPAACISATGLTVPYEKWKT